MSDGLDRPAVARRVWGALGLGVWLGCATPIAPPAEAPGARPARVARALDRDFFVRQSVVARFADTERRLEIVLQSRCDELRVIGLTPFGMRLFTAVRDAEGLRVDALSGTELPVQPERVLRDIERTFFRSSPPLAAGEREVAFGEERVIERFEAGRLVERRVFGKDGSDTPELRIRYAGPVAAAGIRERVSLESPTLGYALEIHNHQIEELSCAGGS